MMTMAGASLHVTKLAAAKRQLQAAIRMYFMPEEELAVHTVAAATYGILKDLKRERGMNEAADVYQSMIFYIVRDFRRGTLPDHMTSDPEFMSEVNKLAYELPRITADSKLSDVCVTIGRTLEREYWTKANRISNFLKHADRDTEAAVALDEIDNKLLLTRCCCAYRDVAPDDLGTEGLVFAAFVSANNPAYRIGGTSFDSLVTSLRKVSVGQQANVCETIIREFHADD